MEAWQKLVAAALVGTERQTPELPHLEGDLQGLIGQLDWAQPEGAILAAAGAIALHQQIGQLPLKKDWTIEPCPQDDQLIITTAIASKLIDQRARRAPALPKLLSRIAQAGQRIPQQEIVPLLERAQENPSLQPYAAAVIGKRGRWLAERHPAWSFATMDGLRGFFFDSPQSQEIWVHGRRDERLFLFERWRESDPHGARQALEAVWSKEPARDRAEFVKLLEINLTMADEPLLESTLGKRAKSVSNEAICLLVRLPESRLCQRMTERVQKFVRPIENDVGLHFHITIPKTHDAQWERDGISEKAPSGESQRDWWLLAMVSATPLDVWGASSQVFAAVQDRPHQKIFLRGCAMAIQNQRRSDWANAFFHYLDSSTEDRYINTQLKKLLNQEQRERWLGEQLPRQPGGNITELGDDAALRR
ncbi:MAG: DUF5691 domain-containing protein [Cyanophyceae cyanobacterium]